MDSSGDFDIEGGYEMETNCSMKDEKRTNA